MKPPSPAQIHLHRSLETLYYDFSQWLAESIHAFPYPDQPFHIAIPGGETPESLFRYLAGSGGDCIPWERLHFWWTDERMVPTDDPRSNYHMAEQALLISRKIALGRIHRIQTELTPEDAAKAYTTEIEQHLSRTSTGTPFFQLALLGIGEDGHIASLFPNHDTNETGSSVQVIEHHSLIRISLPYKILIASSHLAFLVTGTHKALILKRIFSPKTNMDRTLPAAILSHHRPDAHWFLDFAAGHSFQSGSL